jgi:hypothetical protein
VDSLAEHRDFAGIRRAYRNVAAVAETSGERTAGGWAVLARTGGAGFSPLPPQTGLQHRILIKAPVTKRLPEGGCCPRPMRTPVSIRRFIFLIASVAPAWALIAAVTDGFSWRLGPIRVSSTEPVRPLIVGVTAGVVWYLWRSSDSQRHGDGRWLATSLKGLARLAVPIIIVLGLVVGIRYGTFAAAGSDSYGYLSQARLWASGRLHVEQPFVEQFSWPDREWVFSPLGYRPQSASGTIVPTYAPGLPMVMAVFLRVFGANSPFFVVPLFGALALWFTYLLGRAVTRSSTAGACAALLLLASPVFLAHVMVPMSDVPAAALWTLVMLLTIQRKPRAAGVVAGLALLIRPNLLLLALAPPIAWNGRRSAARAYITGLAPLVLVIAAINFYLYGSPVSSGYGGIGDNYSIAPVWQNTMNYTAWLVQTHTPLIALMLLPLLVREALWAEGDRVSPRRCLGAMIGLTFASYLPYGVFDHWFYLRFLLPALPAMFVLAAAAIRFLCHRMPSFIGAPAALVTVAAVVPFTVKVGADEGIFRQALSIT